MPVVRVHGPLKKLAGGVSEHSVSGDCVSSVLRALEQEHPALAGWVFDERGLIRQHINVYVNGERGAGETSVGQGDKVEVLPAISGG
jgi:sulfur-carrier protein